MEKNHRILFDLLLKKVGNKLQESHPEVGHSMENWNGEEITLLREDLQQKVLGTISEKWYYTHVKNQQNKLPRIDTLNLLAKYVEEQSWKSLCFKYNKPSKITTGIDSTISTEKSASIKVIIVSIIITILLSGLFLSIYFTNTSKSNYKFCFVDKNTHLPVVDSFLEIKIIKNSETPLSYPLKSNCFNGKGKKIEFIVQGRFYKPTQIKRIIDQSSYEETIFVIPDDYAMILHLFTNSKVEDWKKRRIQLSEMIHDDLKAYQISNDGFTIDIFNKNEFINKMTLPTRGLKKTAIISTEYNNEKISTIKFIQG